MNRSQIENELRVVAMVAKYPAKYLDAVVVRLHAGDFFVNCHWRALDTIVRLRDAGLPVDDQSGIVIPALIDGGVLSEDRRPDTILTTDFIDALDNAIPTNINHYIDRIIERSQSQEVERLTRAAMNAVGARNGDACEIAEQLKASLDAVINRRSLEVRKLTEATIRAVDGFERDMVKGVLPTIPTGFKQLDAYVGGLQRGGLFVIAARPSEGKTSLGVGILKNVALQGLNCLFCSLEPTEIEIVQRDLIANNVVNPDTFTKNQISPSIISAARASLAGIARRDYWIYHNPSARVKEIRAAAIHCANRGGLDVLLIDYLQSIKKPSKFFNHAGSDRCKH